MRQRRYLRTACYLDALTHHLGCPRKLITKESKYSRSLLMIAMISYRGGALPGLSGDVRSIRYVGNNKLEPLEEWER